MRFKLDLKRLDAAREMARYDALTPEERLRIAEGNGVLPPREPMQLDARAGRRALRRVGIAMSVAIAALIGMAWLIHESSDRVCTKVRSGSTFSGDKTGCQEWRPVSPRSHP